MERGSPPPQKRDIDVASAGIAAANPLGLLGHEISNFEPSTERQH
jgi:hypothetical protein